MYCGLFGSSCEILVMLNYRTELVLTTCPGKLEKILVDGRNNLHMLIVCWVLRVLLDESQVMPTEMQNFPVTFSRHFFSSLGQIPNSPTQLSPRSEAFSSDMTALSSRTSTPFFLC